jgi:hypothetical protein
LEKLMQPDLYTKAVLTIIALCLIVLAFESLSTHVAPNAHAQEVAVSAEVTAGDTVSCRVPGNGYKRCLPVIMGQ